MLELDPKGLEAADRAVAALGWDSTSRSLRFAMREIGQVAIRAYLEAIKSAEKDDGWIEWKGGECPVPEDTKVDVRFRDGNAYDGARARLWAKLPRELPSLWGQRGSDDDIIAYRISKQSEER